MTIAQITDLHMSAKAGCDVDVAARFQKILEDVLKNGAHLIVLTGDLVMREKDEETCVFIKNRLDALGVPYRLTPGNHDNLGLLSSIFGLPPRPEGELYDGESIAGRTILFLDSARARFSAAQWRWFEKAVKKTREEVLIFMHHPPCPAGVPFMDRDWAFQMSNEFQERLIRLKKTVTVFCGHYHVDKVVKAGNLTAFICPAVFIQFDETADEYRVGSYRYGWRKIELGDGYWRTSVRYIE